MIINAESKPYLEIEIKIPIPHHSLPHFRRLLPEIGFPPLIPRLFEKNILFDTKNNSLKQLKHVLRLRRTGNQNILTFKRPVHNAPDAYKVREEFETSVDDFETMKRILEGLGYLPWFAYEKYRETFGQNTIHVLLDETPIGCYIEIEGPAPLIDHAAAQLGFSPQNYITENYLTLFLNSGGTGDMVF